MASRETKIDLVFAGNSAGAEAAVRALESRAAELKAKVAELERSEKDATGQTKELGDAAEKAGGQADKAGGHFGGLGGAVKQAATVAGGFILAEGIMKAPGFLTDAAKAAAEDEAATKRLDQALRNAGGSFDDNKAKVDARIASGAKLAFGDDDIRNSFQSLLVATDDVDEALRRQSVAMDLARGTGMSLEQASKLVGKVNEENVDTFKKLGIEIPKGATEAEALALVQAKFAGQADTYASSTAAQFEKFNIAMGELKESIGTAVLPILTAVGTVLTTTVMPALSAIVDNVAPRIAGVLEPAIAGIGAAFQALEPFLLPIAAGIGAVATVILVSMIPAIVAWTIAEWAKVTALAAAAVAFIAANAPLIAIAAGIALLVAAIVLVIQHWDQITAKVPALGVAFDAVKAAIQVVLDWFAGPFKEAMQAVYDTVKDKIEAAIGFVRDNWGTIQTIIEPVVNAVKAYIELTFGLIRVYFETWWGIVKGIFDVALGIFTGDWQRAWDGVKQIITTVWDGIKGVFETVLGAIDTLTGGKVTVLKGYIDDFANKIDWARDFISGALNAIGGFFEDLKNMVLGPIQAIIDKIQGLIDKITSIPHPSIPGFGGGVDVPFFAGGTLSAPGGLAVVGERGPELVALPRGSRVYSNAESRALVSSPGSGLGGGVTVNIHGDVYARNEGEASQAAGRLGWGVRAALRARGAA